MLTIGKLGAGQARYYEEAIAREREDYYAGRGENPGEWIGRGSAALGLGGTLERGQLEALLDGEAMASAGAVEGSPELAQRVDRAVDKRVHRLVAHRLDIDLKDVRQVLVDGKPHAMAAAIATHAERARRAVDRDEVEARVRSQAAGASHVELAGQSSRSLERRRERRAVQAERIRMLGREWREAAEAAVPEAERVQVRQECIDLTDRALVDLSRSRGARAMVLPDGRVLERDRAVKVQGFDLHFAPPKSVTLMWALGGGDVGATVLAAHHQAVERAVDYVERVACATRRGLGGAEVHRGEGLIGARFDHRTSRAGDPQLHSHVVVANATRTADGRCSSLDGTRLYREAKTAGMLYQAELRRELTRTLGVRWKQVVNGLADVDGVSEELIAEFSTRRAEIEHELAERGESTARSAQRAALRTRSVKEYDVDAESIHDEWRARAQELGGLELGPVIGRADTAGEDVDVEHVASLVAGLTQQQSTFTRREVLQLVAEHAAAGATIEQAEAIADQVLGASVDAVVVTNAAAATPLQEVVNADGRTMPADWHDQRYSTRDLVAAERAILDAEHERRGAGTCQVDSERVRGYLEQPEAATLGVDQRAMVEALTTSGNGVDLVLGAAGRGKTYATDHARRIWEAEGYTLLGASLSKSAALELRDAGIADTRSIAALRMAIAGGAVQLTPRTVLIVDEAGMVGTRELARLVDEVNIAGAKLVLIGDDRQLPEIEAGGAFRALLKQGHPIELVENRRQRHEWEQRALDELRSGDVGRWLEQYVEHGRVLHGTEPDQVRARLARDWHEARQRGADATMIGLRVEDVDTLNVLGRELVDAAGELRGTRVTIAGREWAVGDALVCNRNFKPAVPAGLTKAERRARTAERELVNGMRGTVVAIDVGTDGSLRTLTIELPDGERRRIHPEYLRDHASYGYAITGHKAQGKSYDEVFVLGSDVATREWGYVAMSRNRDTTHYYVTSPGLDPNAPGFDTTRDDRDPEGQALGETWRLMERSGAKELATLEEVSPSQLEWPQLREARLQVGAERHRLEQQRAELDPSVVARQERTLADRAAALDQERVRRTQQVRDRLQQRQPPAAIAGELGMRPRRGEAREDWLDRAVVLEVDRLERGEVRYRGPSRGPVEQHHARSRVRTP